MKKTVCIFAAIVLLSSCLSEKYRDLNDGMYAEIQTNKGTIFLELFVKNTPKTVANFVSLVEGNHPKVNAKYKGTNFYKDLVFHRVVPNFVIQAGAYTAKAKHNAGYVFGDEFPRDSLQNLIYKHNQKGLLSMANGGLKTNNSQFFITHRAIPHLDAKHSIFGKTTINSKTLKQLKLQFKDTLTLSKAIDSARMAVVNAIRKNDTITDINIIRIGSYAKNFDAPTVFTAQENQFIANEAKRKEQAKTLEAKRYANYLKDKAAFYKKMKADKALPTGTGLKILKTKTTKQKKVVLTSKVTANYTLYIANGKKMQSSLDDKNPTVFNLNDTDKPLLSGLKEGLLLLKEGEKALLFVPYAIGFGEEEFGPYPKKSDLVFDIEVLKVN